MEDDDVSRSMLGKQPDQYLKIEQSTQPIFRLTC